MKILELLRNPIIKYLGIALVLYFALFNNKQHPKSLGNRLSTENVKQGYEDLQNKRKFISSNLKLADDLARDPKLQAKLTTSSKNISYEDLEIGSGDETVSCGDIAKIAYGFYASGGRQLDFIDSDTVTIGSNTKNLLEKNISGMKVSGIRYISIPKDFRVADRNIMQLLSRSDGDLKIQVTLLSFAKSTASNLSCN